VSISDESAEISGRAVVTDIDLAAPPPRAGATTIDQMPGWPIPIGGDITFAPSRGLAFGDLDRDGTLEIVASSTDKKLYAWDFTGASLPGFPVTLIEKAQTAPTVADLDGDGDMEIVQFTRGLTNGGRLYVVDHEGQVAPGFPVSLSNNNLAGSPTVRDLDDDGFLEILVPERAYPIGYLHVFEHDGTEWGGNWPVALDHVPTGSAAVGDLDGDGDDEVVYLSYNSIYCLELDGSSMAGWPKSIPNANFSYQSPALADLDDDGDLEIAVGAHKDAAGCYVYHHTGALVTGWPRYTTSWTYCAPTIVDLDGDGEHEILDGQAGGLTPPSICFHVWNENGTAFPGFPYTGLGGSEGPLTIADVDNDGEMEILADSNIASGGLGYLYGVDTDGSDLPGFPLRPEGFTHLNGATIGDVDGDGDYELGVISFVDATSPRVNLYDLPGTYHPADVPWETYHQNGRRGGLLGSEDGLHVQGFFGLGSTVDFILHDTPGYKAFLVASRATDKRFFNGLGWFLLDRTQWTKLFVDKTIPESGEYVWTKALPTNPNLVGRTFYLQGVTGPDPLNRDGTFTNMLGRTVQ
jgi:hypothetical protein